MTSHIIKKSLRYSTLDGLFASVVLGICDNFTTPYAIAMGAGAGLIALLASVPMFASSLTQLRSASMVERLGSRKALINTAVLIQSLLLVPVIAIPYVFNSHRAACLIFFYTLFASAGALAFPAWSSLMSDHIAETERGKFFGWRNRLLGIVNVASMLLAGLTLYFYNTLTGSGRGIAGNLSGFTLIFTIAFLARLISWKFLTKMYEPPLVIKEEHKFTFKAFLKRIRRSNFGRFVLFVASMNFAVFIGAPFLPVYMLRDLKFDYLLYTLITMTATLTMLLVMNHWGLHADHVGNRRVLRLTSFFIPLIPVLWLFSHNVIYLMFVQIFAGFFWGGFNLSASNFIYDAVTPEKRTRCIAYYNVMNGLAVVSGSLLGGYLVKVMPPIFGYKILGVLIISGIMRFASAFLCSYVREVRPVKNISNARLFYSIIGARPLLPVSGGAEE